MRLESFRTTMTALTALSREEWSFRICPGYQQCRGILISDRLALSRSIRPPRELHSRLDERILPQHALTQAYSASMMSCARERRRSLVLVVIDIDGDA